MRWLPGHRQRSLAVPYVRRRLLRHLPGLLATSSAVASCGTTPGRTLLAALSEPVICISGAGPPLPLVQKLTEAFTACAVGSIGLALLAIERPALVRVLALDGVLPTLEAYGYAAIEP